MSIEHYEHEHPLDRLAITRASGSESDAERAEREEEEQPAGAAK
jgi:hypothetical protein